MGLPTDVFSFIGNPLAAVINGISNNVAVNKQNQANLDVANATNEAAIKINQDNIALQQQENYKNRVFNAGQADLAFQRQVKMQQMQNQWNSPIELAQRYAQAGINPNVAFGNGTMQAASPSVGSSPSASYNTGLSPSLPNLSTPRMEAAPSVATGVIDSLSKIANIDKVLAESKHQKEQAEQLRTTRDLIIKNLQEDANGKSIANELQQQYGALLHESKIQEQMTSAMKNIGAFNEALANADYQRANKELAEATKNLRDAETKTQGEEYRKLKLANDNFVPMLNAKLNLLNQQANLAGQRAHEIETLLDDKEFKLQAERKLTNALWRLTDSQRNNAEEMREVIKANAKKAIEDYKGQAWINQFNQRNEVTLDDMLDARLKNIDASTVTKLLNTGGNLFDHVFSGGIFKKMNVFVK